MTTNTDPLTPDVETPGPDTPVEIPVETPSEPTTIEATTEQWIADHPNETVRLIDHAKALVARAREMKLDKLNFAPDNIKVLTSSTTSPGGNPLFGSMVWIQFKAEQMIIGLSVTDEPCLIYAPTNVVNSLLGRHYALKTDPGGTFDTAISQARDLRTVNLLDSSAMLSKFLEVADPFFPMVEEDVLL